MLQAAPQRLIRVATEDDIDDLVQLGVSFMLNSHYQHFLQVNSDRLDEAMRAMVTGDNAEIFVAEKGGEIVGMIGVAAYLHPFSKEKTVAELFWWVEPRHRGAGIRLLKKAAAWAKHVGAEIFQVTAPTKKVAKLYKRYGFRRLEETYSMRL